MRALLSIALSLSLIPSLSAQPWTATYGGGDVDYGTSVTVLPDGGFAAVGVTLDGNYESVLVVRTDADGDSLWTSELSMGDGAERAFNILPSSDGGFLVLGTAYFPSVFNFRPWLVKLNAGGSTVFSTDGELEINLPVNSGIIDGFERPDGTFVIAGGSPAWSAPRHPPRGRRRLPL